jgi:hypothetical protein
MFSIFDVSGIEFDYCFAFLLQREYGGRWGFFVQSSEVASQRLEAIWLRGYDQR